jgi:hypothetical protein
MTSTFNIFRNATSAPKNASASVLASSIPMSGGQTARAQSVATTGVYVTGPAADHNFDALAWRGAG